MPHSRENLERQLSRAEAARAACEEELKAENSDVVLKRQPKWRTLNAKCKRLESRLRTVSAKEAIGSASGSDDE